MMAISRFYRACRSSALDEMATARKSWPLLIIGHAYHEKYCATLRLGEWRRSDANQRQRYAGIEALTRAIKCDARRPADAHGVGVKSTIGFNCREKNKHSLASSAEDTLPRYSLEMTYIVHLVAASS